MDKPRKPWIFRCDQHPSLAVRMGGKYLQFRGGAYVTHSEDEGQFLLAFGENDSMVTCAGWPDKPDDPPPAPTPRSSTKAPRLAGATA